MERREVETATVYGIAGANGFSMGITVLSDLNGRPLGHVGWTMIFVNAHACR